MIPYDELVIALQTWRAKKGLPVSQMSGSLAPPPVVKPAARTAPSAPPPRAKPRQAPPPAEMIDGASLLDEPIDQLAEPLDDGSYDNEGSDFAMNFGAEADGESTSIGSPPPRPSDLTDPTGGLPRGAKRNDDW
jgi:hypothetical protein